MKKIISGLAVVCVILLCVILLQNKKIADVTADKTAAPAETTETVVTEQPEAAAEAETAEPAEAEAAAEPKAVDYAALFATHEPTDVIVTANGTEISWDEYCYWLYNTIYNLEYTYGYYYGTGVDWSAEAEEGTTFNQYAVKTTESYILNEQAIFDFAADNGITITDDIQAELDKTFADAIVNYCGEGATEEDFEQYLSERFISTSFFKKLNTLNYLYNNFAKILYGENGENITGEEAVAYLEDNGYMYAAHILLPVVDLSTGEALDADAVEAAKTQAAELAAELQAITNDEERLAKFYEYMNEYSQDSGLKAYPEGYTFTSGKMVSEFENAVLALDNYCVSDPVLSTYGYHVIIRLPLSADAIISYNSTTGEPEYIRGIMASEKITKALAEKTAEVELKYVCDMSGLNLADFTA